MNKRWHKREPELKNGVIRNHNKHEQKLFRTIY